MINTLGSNKHKLVTTASTWAQASDKLKIPKCSKPCNEFNFRFIPLTFPSLKNLRAETRGSFKLLASAIWTNTETNENLQYRYIFTTLT